MRTLSFERSPLGTEGPTHTGVYGPSLDAVDFLSPGGTVPVENWVSSVCVNL